MKKKRMPYKKKIKSKNILSNFFITMQVVFDALSILIVVLTVGKLMDDTITLDKILINGGAIAVCLAFKALFYGLSIEKAHQAAYSVLTEIRITMIQHLKKMSLGFFQKRKTGDLTNIINHDVEQVELYLAHALPEIMSATLIPVISFFIVLLMDWRLGLGLICTAPLMVLLRKLLNRLWAGSVRHYTQSTQKMSADLLEYIATIPVIKAFAREEQKTKSVLDGMHEYIRWVKRWVISLSLPMSFITMMLEGGLVVMIIIGSVLLSRQQIHLQNFVLAFIFGGIYTTSFAKLATFQHYGIVFDRAMSSIGSVMNVVPAEKNSTAGNETDVNTGNIVFKDVSFSYEKEKATLFQINLTFKENSVNAVVGTSGSGKSTLANLMMGFWPPDSGLISIGSKDITHIPSQDFTNLISIVQQEVFLFNLSIEENIRIGKQDANRKEIIRAAKRAQIHDFIMSLPQGYATSVGEAGVKFSGGERQRIAIARLMLKDTPIIILDEATAAIDPNNEHLIQKAISNLGSSKTIIMIAHHLNTIKHVDQIVVMDAGRVVACGEHETLLTSCPLYAKMVEYQAKVDTWQIKERQS